MLKYLGKLKFYRQKYTTYTMNACMGTLLSRPFVPFLSFGYFDYIVKSVTFLTLFIYLYSLTDLA